ncbi:uncharacterized protein LOC132543457 [Ylistrum balloti]|uniref:uncharacterized protein LOC132543457 n=1 Tax=Ylistrum balloti TaxID=509963 RepID=UPI0029058CA0|nr:uncharacterized protein LOC132543457 [Ylistrum balloti]
MQFPAVGQPRGRAGRQSPDVSPKSCVITGKREKLPKADGSKPVRRQTLAPICTPVNRPAAGCTPKLSGVDMHHQRHSNICGRTSLSRPPVHDNSDFPTETQLSKRSKVASKSLLGRTQYDRRQTPEKCSGVFGSIAHNLAKDAMPSSDEDEFYRQYLTDQTRSNGHRQSNLPGLNTEDDEYRHSVSSKMSHKELELMHYQQTLLEQMMSPTESEICRDLKSRTGKRSEKGICKKGKDKKNNIELSGHKFEDLPLLRQTRLRVSMDPDSAVPEEAQYVPTPPGFEKIPCRAMSSMSGATSPASRKVRFNTEERGVQRRD